MGNRRLEEPPPLGALALHVVELVHEAPPLLLAEAAPHGVEDLEMLLLELLEAGV